jgi:hypothetical protein
MTMPRSNGRCAKNKLPSYVDRSFKHTLSLRSISKSAAIIPVLAISTSGRIAQQQKGEGSNLSTKTASLAWKNPEGQYTLPFSTNLPGCFPAVYDWKFCWQVLNALEHLKLI